MEVKRIVKSDQEQAIASWINYLNQLRIIHLCDELKAQDINYQEAIKILDTSLGIIQNHIVDSNRGGEKGLHGFIAEIAEVGIENAKEAVNGNKPNSVWLNDNGPIDIIRIIEKKEGIITEQIQQKFYQSGDGLSLEAIQKHLEKYPDFLKNGGKYQIPKDQYDKIIKLLQMPEKEANKLQTSDGSFSLKQWKFVHEFFEKSEIKIDDIEASDFEYKDVQKGTINNAINKRKEEIKETDKKIRNKAYEKSLPSFKEGIKITLVSAVFEGAAVFSIEVLKISKKKGGIRNLTKKDWEIIFGKTGYGTAKGGTRGAAVYVLTNFAAAPVAVATAMVTASFGIAEQIYQYRKGNISETEMIIKAEYLCLDASMSALTTILGQFAIPIPILGAIIGNTVGMMIYNILKEKYLEKEKAIFDGYINSINQLEQELSKQYLMTAKKIQAELESFIYVCDNAFSIDPKIALEGSIQLSKLAGVQDGMILKSKEDINRYFMG